MTFIADANVLIDLGFVDGLDILPALDTTEVLDIVLTECLEPPDLTDNIQAANIKPVESETSWLNAAKPYQTGRLSIADVLTFHYAKTQGCTVLTNEKPLRKLCDREQVPFHGLLWIIEQAYHLNLRTAQELCVWLITLEQVGSRLPKPELATLQQTLGCQNLPNEE